MVADAHLLKDNDMLEWIDSADDVLALKISGKITGADLDSIMGRLEQAMARHDKVHVFVETSAIDAIEISALPSYTARAMPLFGKLSHFVRVALVADQGWIRFATRVESAILPFISYRTFTPSGRDEALRWVMDRPST
jgi:hypothetical protein